MSCRAKQAIRRRLFGLYPDNFIQLGGMLQMKATELVQLTKCTLKLASLFHQLKYLWRLANECWNFRRRAPGHRPEVIPAQMACLAPRLDSYPRAVQHPKTRAPSAAHSPAQSHSHPSPRRGCSATNNLRLRQTLTKKSLSEPGGGGVEQEFLNSSKGGSAVSFPPKSPFKQRSKILI